MARASAATDGVGGCAGGIAEYLRPWKLATFAVGLGLLILGARYYRQYDWDIGISLIMGALAYVTAPFVFRVVKSCRWKMLPVAALAYWFTVDGSYTGYNAWMGHPVTMDLRRANFLASSLLYFLCGWLWLPRKSLREIFTKSTNDNASDRGLPRN